MITRQQQRERGVKRLEFMRAAADKAGIDFDFASHGFNPLKFTKEQKVAIRSAICGAAETGAAMVFDSLSTK